MQYSCSDSKIYTDKLEVDPDIVAHKFCLYLYAIVTIGTLKMKKATRKNTRNSDSGLWKQILTTAQIQKNFHKY